MFRRTKCSRLKIVLCKEGDPCLRLCIKGKLSKGSGNNTGSQGRRGMNHGWLWPEVTQRSIMLFNLQAVYLCCSGS